MALVRPDGVTVEHEYSPAYPALANDESYGIHFTARTPLVQGSAVKYLVPVNDSPGLTWTAKDFNDASWAKGKTGLGFGVGVPGFTVRQVAAKPSFGPVNTIATCDALLALPKGHANILSEATVVALAYQLPRRWRRGVTMTATCRCPMARPSPMHSWPLDPSPSRWLAIMCLV